MSRNLESPTKLTEFAPLSPEVKQPGVGFIFSRFFKIKKGSRDLSPSQASTDSISVQSAPFVSRDVSPLEQPRNIDVSSDWQQDEISDMDKCSGKSQSSQHHSVLFPGYREVGDGRSLPNVLKRISSLLAMKSSGLQAYKDTDFKQYWMPDSVSKECYECGEKFTTFRRRHHCRVCGQIFCSRCCNQEIPGKIMGCTGDLRVCTYCCRVVLSYLQSADMGADLSADLRAVQEDLQTKFGSGTEIRNSTTEIKNSVSRGSVRRKMSVGYQEERFALGRGGRSEDSHLSLEEKWKALQGSASLRTLFDEVCNPATGVVLQAHRYRLRSFPGCFVGSELVDWLLSQNKAATRSQAIAIGQALIEGGYVECISSQEQLFQDGYVLYRPRQISPLDGSAPPSTEHSPQLMKRSSSQDTQEPLWVKQIGHQDSAATDSESDSARRGSDKESIQDSVSIPSSSSIFYLDLNVKENRVHIMKPKQEEEDLKTKEEYRVAGDYSTVLSVQCHDSSHTGISKEFLKDTLLVQTAQNREMVPPTGWHKVQHLRVENGEQQAYDQLSEAYRQHEYNLLKQLLNAEGLSQSWSDIILPLAHEIIDFVKPDVRNDTDDMDIRQYVQFKKVPGGRRTESTIINGVVCTKNIAHRAMSAKLSNPRILLLGCSIVYQRVESKFLSLEPLMMQEYDYLKNVVARIAALQPDLVLVEKNVSRLAQDFLLFQEVTLVLNVKPTVLERISRCTQADIVTSVDAHIGRPQIGMCHNFYLRTFTLDDGSTKTLMFLDGCATHLGCTVLLRGASNAELKRVKKIMSHMIFVNYSWRLEKSFLMDEFVMPPSPPTDSFFEDPESERESKKKSSSGNDACESDFIDQCSIEEGSSPFETVMNDDVFSPKVNGSASVDASKHISPADDVIESEIFRLDRTESTERDGNCKEQQDGSVQRKPYMRSGNKEKSLSEEKKIETRSETVSDFSDPLHSYLNLEDGNDEVFTMQSPQDTKLSVAVLPLSNQFRKALDDIILSSSPYLQYSIPYLETETGRNCELRKYFPEEIYWSAQFYKTETSHAKLEDTVWKSNEQDIDIFNNLKVQPHHNFLHAKLTSPVDNLDIQRMLADFRASGGRIVLTDVCEKKGKASGEAYKNELDVPWEFKVDALDPYNHQRLAVLFCSYSRSSSNAPCFCVNPWIVHMDFYGRNDIPLGSFLERYCFRTSYACPSQNCETSMLNHIRRFVHDGGCVHIVLKELDNQIPGEGNTILMWSWCRQCKLVSPVVPMSVDTWSLSFAKYLELRFHGHMYTRRGREDTCQHSLHHEHYQYFGLKNIVASFKYTTVTLWEVSLPPSIITLKFNVFPPNYVIEEIRNLALKGYEVYSSILEKLCSLAAESEGTKHEAVASMMKAQLQKEQACFKAKIEEIQLKLTSPTLEAKKIEVCQGRIKEKDVQELMWKIEDCVVQLKRLIAEAVYNWNVRIQDFVTQKKKDDKPTKLSSTSRTLSAFSTDSPLKAAEEEQSDTSVHKNMVDEKRVDRCDLHDDPKTEFNDSQQVLDSDSSEFLESTNESEFEDTLTEETKLPVFPHKLFPASIPRVESDPMISSISTTCDDARSLLDSNQSDELRVCEVGATSSPRLTPKQLSGNNAVVGVHLRGSASSSPSHAEEEHEPEQGFSRAWALEHDYVVIDHIEEDGEIGDNKEKTQSNASGCGRGHERSYSDGGVSLVAQSSVATTEDSVDTKQEKKTLPAGTVKHIFSQLLPSMSVMTPIQSPLPSQEHHLLPPSATVPIVVYEGEPSSIIAYSLTCAEYKKSLQELRSQLTGSQKLADKEQQPTGSPVAKRKTTPSQDRDGTPVATDINSSIESILSRRSGVLSFLRGTSSSTSSSGMTSTPTRQNRSEYEGVQYTAGMERDASMEGDERLETGKMETDKSKSSGGGSKGGVQPHIEIQFSDSTTQFFCRVYFAEHFLLLRQLVFPHGEESYARSLSRCVHWAARGGKSGSTFCKTKDDRFILKEMTRLEVQLFLEFASNYFQYMHRVHTTQQPTLLGKIVGIYRVVYKNTATNVAFRSYLLVMENLFYARSVTQKFDLKGSVRNRLVNPAAEQEGEIVLLDENLLRMTCDSPLYIQPHSKTVLTLAINNDTQFLAAQAVMDYSLLVGLDESKKELVVGIIDYIRTFTWDKKLETIVKSSGILGGQGKLPTVINPDNYRARFIAAMHRYFLPVPDRWTGLGKGVDC